MRRREFISILSGAAAAWPLAGHAQQPGKFRTIGFLGAASPSAASQWVAALVQRLRELGWIEGHTLAIQYRWAEGRNDRLAEIAAEFVRRSNDAFNCLTFCSASASKAFFSATTYSYGFGSILKSTSPSLSGEFVWTGTSTTRPLTLGNIGVTGK